MAPLRTSRNRNENMDQGILKTTSVLSRADKWDHLLARAGYRRMYHRVDPGLYSLGNPTPESNVFVTANYTLSFDALRTALKGVDCFILVLDTKGINVWCAAGKGTFGTDELVSKIQSTALEKAVIHRRVILPQLAAPGVAAHEVRKRTGFSVEYGPVRAEDLPLNLQTHQATEEMRRVRFDLKDRASLVPVEIKNNMLWAVPVPIILYLVSGLWMALLALAIFVAGVVLFPLLLPFLPTKHFASKGIILGAAAGFAVWLARFLSGGWSFGVEAFGYLITYALLVSPWVGYISLNFTGASTYTSKTGVRREIFRFVPVMALMFICGLVMLAILGLANTLGW